MKKAWILLLVVSMSVLLVFSFLDAQQRRRRAPWEERSPAVGTIATDFQVYNQKLQKTSLSNLYHDNLTYFVWGGCT
jgi:hypothetical protein